MTIHRCLAAAVCAALMAGPALGQILLTNNSGVADGGWQTIVRPPAYALGYGAFNPNYGTPAYVPGVGFAYYPSHTGLRASYWSLPGRYNAYPWSGAGVYTGGTAVYAYYAPSFIAASGIEVGPAFPYSTYSSYSPPSGGGYGSAYAAGTLYQAEPAIGAYRPAVSSYPTPPPAPADRAVVDVRLPADAALWVEGAATKQTGAERSYVSPPLIPGRPYQYTIRAQWKAAGKTIEKTQTMTVRAGDRSELLFLAGR